MKSSPFVPIEERLAELAGRTHDALHADFPRGDSAVLLLVVLGPEPGLVLTRRSTSLATDPGFVAFPGGRIDPGETPEQAARRECEEEVGIAGDAITVHGRLDDTWNGAGFRIIPVVASIPGPVTLTVRPEEVDGAAVVALGAATDADNHEVTVATIDGFDFHDDVISLHHDDEHWRIYGPTADLARDLADWIDQRDRRRRGRRQRELDHFSAARWRR